MAMLLACMVAYAQPKPAPIPLTLTTTVKTTPAKVTTPFTTPKPLKQIKVERVEGMSSRPWAQIVGWHPGASKLPDPEQHEGGLYLVSIGHEPWH